MDCLLNFLLLHSARGALHVSKSKIILLHLVPVPSSAPVLLKPPLKIPSLVPRNNRWVEYSQSTQLTMLRVALSPQRAKSSLKPEVMVYIPVSFVMQLDAYSEFFAFVLNSPVKPVSATCSGHACKR